MQDSHRQLVVETSPGNFQAWLKHPEKLEQRNGHAAARALAERFGGDTGAADWRHFGRLGRFHFYVNTKCLDVHKVLFLESFNYVALSHNVCHDRLHVCSGCRE